MILGGSVAADSLTRPDLVFDKESLEARYVATSCLLGAVREDTALDFLRRVCLRTLDRLARRAAGKLGMPAELLRDAWFYSIEMEVWQLIPARHMARALARACGDDPVIFKVPSLTFNYLPHGAETHGIELFYLIYELKRRGVAVALMCEDASVLQQARSAGTLPLRLQPCPDLWLSESPLGTAPAAASHDRAALVGAGIRGIGQVLKISPDPLRIQSGYVMDPAFGTAEESVIDRQHLPVAIDIPLRPGLTDETTGETLLLSATLPHADLGDYMVMALGGATEAAFARARHLVKHHRLTELHICASPFFESSLLAHAVKEVGGKVALWPHSFNIGDIGPLRAPAMVDAIYLPWLPDAVKCRELFPGTPVTVIPNFWLPGCLVPPEAEAGEPLTVVLISNDPISHRLALTDIAIVEQSFRSLFRTIDAMPGVKYVCRPRSQSTLQWMWTLAGRPADFSYTPLSPAAVTFPNMVFLFVNQLSSGLMEGIVRGIPALYLRDDPQMRDYLQLGEQTCLPTGDFDLIMGEIDKCRDPSYRRDLSDRQRAWYEAMTSSSE